MSYPDKIIREVRQLMYEAQKDNYSKDDMEIHMQYQQYHALKYGDTNYLINNDISSQLCVEGVPVLKNEDADEIELKVHVH